MSDLKKLTIGVAAFAAMAVASGAATAQEFVFNKTYTETVEVEWDNSIEVDLGFISTRTSQIDTYGAVYVYGDIYYDSAAIATVDNKQISDHNISITSKDRNDGYLGYIYNQSGNFQGNVAAGNLNQQDNVAAIAEAVSGDYYSQGNANAGVYEVQKIWNAAVYAEDGVYYRYGHYDFFDNTSEISWIDNGSGNFQGNVAAGNLNQQKNALAIAVAADSVLSEATSAVMQEIHGSYVVSGVQNKASINNINGYSGNFQGNAASGNLNQQSNVLSIATHATGS